MRLSRQTFSTSRDALLEPLERRQLLAFGQADLSFGVGGRVVTDIPGATTSTQLREIEVLAGGDVLAGGTGGLVRWNADGTPDASFGTDGRIAPVGATYRDHTVADDGRVYVLVSGAAGGIVVRYTGGGTIDTGFGTGGTALVSTGSAFTPVAIAVQDDGKIVVAGTVKTDANKGSTARVYRLDADGTADTGFGNQASVDVPLGATTLLTPVRKDAIVGLKILSGGRIVIGGSSLVYSPEFFDDEAGVFNPVVYGDSVFAAARLTPSGAPDGSYGAGGVTRAIYASGVDVAPATAFALKADDAVGLAAYTDRLAYAQFNASGAVGFNRTADLDTFGRPIDMAAKRDGRLMVLGAPLQVTNNGFQLAYVTPEGDLSNVVQTADADPDTAELYEAWPAAIAVADDGEILVGGSRTDFAEAYVLAKFDDGTVDAERPDEFATARGNDVVRDAAGGLHLAYFDAAERILKYAYRAPNGLWNAPVIVDGAPESGHYLSIAADDNGRPGIAYFDGFHGDLKYAFSPVGGGWDLHVVESGGQVGLYPSLQFDRSLRATIAYYKKTGGDLKLAVLQPEGAWSYELVDAENDVGRSTALTPQPISGRWSIAYTDTTNNTVKFAWRTSKRVWQIETAATTLGGADYLSLAYNPFSEPPGVYQRAAISFYDGFASDLKITQSNGETWTAKALATHGAQGFHSALTFDAFYGPTVYYYNRTADRVTSLTDSFYDGVTVQTIIGSGGRFLSLFSDGNSLDVAFFDEAEGTLKVRTLPLRV
jgi:uncharacterized delta-60 repeat protein